MGRLFGTDGVRGVANSELTPELAFKLGEAGATVLRREKGRPVVLIGKDTRVSGDMLEDALSAGILSVGGNVIKVGVMPTPAIAWLVKHYQADVGVVISASHNPFEYNGIKFFNSRGFKLDDDIEDEIESLIYKDKDSSDSVTGEELGRSLTAEENATQLYCSYLTKTMDRSLDGIKLVLDCANGAAYEVAEMAYKALGAEVSLIGNTPNGTNINSKCGSTHPEWLQQQVTAQGAFMGLAFDGDADRLIAIDERGRIIDGDQIICICTKMLKETGQLKQDKVTTTVMSNIGLHEYMKALGCHVEVAGVGDRYVLERMLQTECIIGGEQSGHIIFLNHSTTGDGILSSLQLVKAILRSGKKPSECADEISIYPQVLINARVKNENKKRFKADPEICEAIEKAEAKLPNGRVLIRPSGTEPLVRVMLEGQDVEMLQSIGQNLAEQLTKKFG